MTRPTDIDQEERAVGAALRAALPPPPGTTDPAALDAAFLGSLRAAPSDPPPPPDLASRLAGIARRALARARRRALLRRAAALLLAVLLLAGCAAAATRLWRELRFTDKTGAVSDEWTVCGDVWTLGGNWAESRGLRHGTMPLEWKAPVDTNIELRARIRLTAGDDPVHGVRVALTSGNRLQPGVEILLEPNRLGVSIGPGHDEWGRWALSGSPGSAVDWFDRPPRETEVPVRIVWHCGVISVFLGDERAPRVQTRKCQSYFDPDEFSEPAVLRIFATGIRLSDLAVRPSVPDPEPPPPVPANLAAGGPPSPAIPPQQTRLVDAVLFLLWLETGPSEDPAAAVPHLRDYSAVSPDPATRAFVTAATNVHASDAAVRVGIGSEAWWNDTWCLPVMQGETVAALCSIDLSPPDADGLSDVRVETAFAEKRGEIVDGDRISARFETRARLRSFDDESLVLGPIPAGSVSTNANARAWLVVAWDPWDHAEEEPHAAATPDSVIAPPTVLP